MPFVNSMNALFVTKAQHYDSLEANDDDDDYDDGDGDDDDDDYDDGDGDDYNYFDCSGHEHIDFTKDRKWIVFLGLLIFVYLPSPTSFNFYVLGHALQQSETNLLQGLNFI